MSVANIGRLQEPFRKRKNGVCEISQTLKRAAKYFRINKLNSQGCEVGFHLEVPSFLLAVYVGQLQKEIHHTVQKGCGITSQQKGDFAAFLYSKVFLLLTMHDLCREKEAWNLKVEANFAAL